MKHQIVVIHGGDSFASPARYLRALRRWPVSKDTFLPHPDWKTNLASDLGRSYEVLQPRMPNKNNAVYREWKIWFERMLPYIHPGVVLIGHSLGGIFLAKYLATTTFRKSIRGLILVAAPHNQTEEIGDFRLPRSLSRVAHQVPQIWLLHSQDDPIVPFAELQAYHRAWPRAKIVVTKRSGHFSQPHLPQVRQIIRRLFAGN